jgi:hypothetical protein
MKRSGFMLNLRATISVMRNAGKLGIFRGAPNAEIVCPHCGVRGRVHTRPVNRKKGISGGKAVGAILTSGLSMLATGLSRKERETEAWCGNCKSVWTL